MSLRVVREKSVGDRMGDVSPASRARDPGRSFGSWPAWWTLLFGCLVIPFASEAGETVYVGANVRAADRVSIGQIDHQAWDRLLREYVDEEGRVDYARWKRTSGDLHALDAYLKRLSTASRQQPATREAELAYWINAYNAVTVRGILREYPTSSIRNHTAKLFGYNIWKDLQLVVDGEGVSLDAIEHEILRKMGEPRIHFAIVCAAKSCPRLLNEAYRADQLDEQLATNGRHFFGQAGNFGLDPSRRTIELSSILKWFGEDFGRRREDRLRAIAPYLPSAEARRAALSGEYRVSYLPYDWSLNSAD